MSLTKGQWESIKHTLSFPWGCVKLDVDGYKLTLQVSQAKPLKFEIVPWVNGKFEGVWLRDDCEERKRFMRPVQVSVYRPVEKKRLLQKFSKKVIKETWGDIDKTFTVYQWGWPTFEPLRRHLIANNKVIELSPEEVEEGID